MGRWNKEVFSVLEPAVFNAAALVIVGIIIHQRIDRKSRRHHHDTSDQVELRARRRKSAQ